MWNGEATKQVSIKFKWATAGGASTGVKQEWSKDSDQPPAASRKACVTMMFHTWPWLQSSLTGLVVSEHSVFPPQGLCTCWSLCLWGFPLDTELTPSFHAAFSSEPRSWITGSTTISFLLLSYPALSSIFIRSTQHLSSYCLSDSSLKINYVRTGVSIFCFVHCYILSAWNSSWHTVGIQQIFVEWIS